MPDSLLLHNIGELVTLEGGPRRGPAEMNDLKILRDAAVYIEEGVIEDVGPETRVMRAAPTDSVRIDCGGRSVVPGFVDPHTHAIYGGDRIDEFEMKLQGARYDDILATGGGILRTVTLTREATTHELLKQLMNRLSRMMEYGTTTAEVKTGYGLDFATERRLLEIIQMADERHPIDIVSTFLGAHAVPPEFADSATYARHVANDMIPEFAELAEFVDVFCEKGVFTVNESREILEAGAQQGLRMKVHADELALSGGSHLASELHAVSADHLLFAGEDERRALAESDVVGVLLPATALSLRAPYADARKLIDAGVLIALATDCNPNCPTESMPFIMSLACHGMRMTPAESLVASTINAAAALDRADDRGAIEEGMLGDLAIIDAPSYRHIPYRFGMNPIWKVIKMGEISVDRSGRRR